MKKILIGLGFLGGIMLISPISLAASRQKALSGGWSFASFINDISIGLKDLGVSNPGLLPTNPFYFLKEWQRSLFKSFTPNPLKRAELELGYLNDRAAEIKKLETIQIDKKSDDASPIINAIDRYELNLNQFQDRLGAVKNRSQEPEMDNLLNELTDNSIKHIELFEDLKNQFPENADLRDKVAEVEGQIYDIVSKLPIDFDSPEVFSERLARAIANNSFGGGNVLGILRDARISEILGGFMERVPDEAALKISELKDALNQEIKERVLQSSDEEKKTITSPDFLNNWPGDQSEIFNGIRQEMDNESSSTPEASDTLNASSTKEDKAGPPESF